MGLSKIPRIVDMFARRLQIQERLTQEMAQDHSGGARSAGRGRDLRGAAFLHDDARRREAALRAVTSAMLGAFRETARRTRDEFLALVRSTLCDAL
jgi:GTP cyclohydrolase I